MFKIGFLPVSFWDVLDIVIVGYLIFQLYKLLRGSIAFNIFTGVVLLYMVWWLVKQLKMDLLAAVLDQFVKVGFIIIIIIFQPEVRRFLLFLGNSTLRQRSQIFDKFLRRNFGEVKSSEKEKRVGALQSALLQMCRFKTGALIVFSNNANLEGLVSTGVKLDAEISEQLLESIFQKESPLHDGAVVIEGSKLRYASVVLPVSENSTLPKHVGLRHRAAVGITEKAAVSVLIVSEETGEIAFANGGQLEQQLDAERLGEILNENLN